MILGWEIPWRTLAFGLGGSALGYVGLVLLLAGCQQHLIYHPSRASEAVLEPRAFSLGLVPWRNAGGDLIGWRHGLPGAKNKLVIFHGNAGQALDRVYLSRVFAAVQEGEAWDIFIFEYPGYGARAGSPSEKTLVKAGREALEELLSQDSRPLFLVGESLGSGVACALAQQLPDNVQGLLLITPFTRLKDAASYHYPWFPVGWILRDRYNNCRVLRGFQGPVAIHVAGQDRVVPAAFGKTLFERYHGPKKIQVEEKAGHNTLGYQIHDPWWQEVTDFLTQVK